MQFEPVTVCAPDFSKVSRQQQAAGSMTPIPRTSVPLDSRLAGRSVHMLAVLRACTLPLLIREARV